MAVLLASERRRRHHRRAASTSTAAPRSGERRRRCPTAGSPTGTASSACPSTPAPTPARCCPTRPARSAGRWSSRRACCPAGCAGWSTSASTARASCPWTARPSSGLFGGYFYINLSHCRVMAIRMGMTVEAFDAALLGSAAASRRPTSRTRTTSAPSARPRSAQTIGEILGRDRRSRRSTPTWSASSARGATGPDLAALSEAELVAHARSFLPELDNAFARARLLDARLGGRPGDAGRGLRRGRPSPRPCST